MPHAKPNITRRYRVAAISQHANSFGLNGHVLIAEDGEAWEVGRSRGPWHASTPFNKGDVVNVALLKIGPDPFGSFKLVPMWAHLSCEIPRRLPDAPQAVVREIWGDYGRSTK